MIQATDNITTGGASLKRAEWIAVAALGLNILAIVFGGGAVWQTGQDNTRRIVSLEGWQEITDNKSLQILIRLERIDANTTALKERMAQ